MSFSHNADQQQHDAINNFLIDIHNEDKDEGAALLSEIRAIQDGDRGIQATNRKKHYDKLSKKAQEELFKKYTNEKFSRKLLYAFLVGSAAFSYFGEAYYAGTNHQFRVEEGRSAGILKDNDQLLIGLSLAILPGEFIANTLFIPTADARNELLKGLFDATYSVLKLMWKYKPATLLFLIYAFSGAAPELLSVAPSVELVVSDPDLQKDLTKATQVLLMVAGVLYYGFFQGHDVLENVANDPFSLKLPRALWQNTRKSKSERMADGVGIGHSSVSSVDRAVRFWFGMSVITDALKLSRAVAFILCLIAAVAAAYIASVTRNPSLINKLYRPEEVEDDEYLAMKEEILAAAGRSYPNRVLFEAKLFISPHILAELAIGVGLYKTLQPYLEENPIAHIGAAMGLTSLAHFLSFRHAALRARINEAVLEAKKLPQASYLLMGIAAIALLADTLGRTVALIPALRKISEMIAGENVFDTSTTDGIYLLATAILASWYIGLADIWYRYAKMISTMQSFFSCCSKDNEAEMQPVPLDELKEGGYTRLNDDRDPEAGVAAIESHDEATPQMGLGLPSSQPTSVTPPELLVRSSSMINFADEEPAEQSRNCWSSLNRGLSNLTRCCSSLFGGSKKSSGSPAAVPLNQKSSGSPAAVPLNPLVGFQR